MGRTKRNLKWLAVLGAVVICCAVAVTVWLVQNPKQTLFDLDPEQVSAITVSNGNKVTRMDIDNPGFSGLRMLQFKGFFKAKGLPVKPKRPLHIRNVECGMCNSFHHLYLHAEAIR